MTDILDPLKKQRGKRNIIKGLAYISIVFGIALLVKFGLSIATFLVLFLVAFHRYVFPVIGMCLAVYVIVNLAKGGEDRNKELLNMSIDEIDKPF